jgi:hypothetical protein
MLSRILRGDEAENMKRLLLRIWGGGMGGAVP